MYIVSLQNLGQYSASTGCDKNGHCGAGAASAGKNYAFAETSHSLQDLAKYSESTGCDSQGHCGAAAASAGDRYAFAETSHSL